MTEKECLWYLINGLVKGSYSVKTFCNEFTRIYDLEVKYDELSNEENRLFGELCEMTGRFSDNDDELKIPNMYFSEKEIMDMVRQINENLA